MIKLARAALIALIGLIASPAFASNATAAFPAPTPAHSLAPGQWPQAKSDLKADPAIRFGALPNGMRYAIMKNATPPGQVSMRLRFDVGSLMERDDQQGLAHFLEHMAFNGSKDVPTRYEMIKDLERLGLAFGADTNAGTGFDATTYKFDLPKSDDASVDTALMLLREIASNLTLSQAAMDQERSVILSEERLRDSPDYRTIKALYGFTMEGQRPPDRFPIGQVPVIKTANRDLIADIYQKYYRPERATLVVVGDIDPAAIEAKIKARFGDWRGRGAGGADPDLGAVQTRASDFLLHVDAGAPTLLDLCWTSPPDLAPDTLAKRRRNLIELLGMDVLNRRLADLARAENPPFISAVAARGDSLRAEELTRVSVRADPQRWKEALAATETEVRRAAQYGVRTDELAREIAEREAALKQAVSGASTRRTPAMADEIAGTLSEEVVETSPADDLAVFESVTKTLTADEVSAALKAAFQGSGPLVFMSSPQPIDGGQAALEAAFEADDVHPVSAPSAPRKVDWPYSSFGAPGRVAARSEAKDLGVVFVRFANGVRLTLKATRFRQDQVLVKVRFGGGLAGLPPDRQAITWAGGAFMEGGLRQISAKDRDLALTGVIYGASFGAEADAFDLGGATRPSDLAAQLQLLAAYVVDPGWRPEALARWKAAYATTLDQLDSTDSSVLGRDLAGLLHSGDRRWTFPSKDDIGAATPETLRAALDPGLRSSPLEVVIVGDVDVDKTIDLVARTFGALPRRPDPKPPAPPAHVPQFPAPVASPVTESHTGRADQGIALIAWPTDDYYADPRQARVNRILADVLRLRLIDTLRMSEGVTYSPVVGSEASQVFPHYGYILAEMEAPPAKLGGFFADISSIAADLRAKPVSDDELARAKKPEIEALEKARNTNQYWLGGLSGAQADPRRLEMLRTAETDLERVTAEDVEKAAQARLRDDRAWKLEIRPKSRATASAGDVRGG
jgi:zinc protease